MIKIRKSTLQDVGPIIDCYTAARQYMRDNGNVKQWSNGYPSRQQIESDIAAGVSYVGEVNGQIVMVFALIFGEDPTYARIFDGSWLNDSGYATIHRLASDGSVKGVLRACFEYCLKFTDNIRVDTHADNHIMQRGVEHLGFRRCGTIICADGTPRIAYQYWRGGE
ncbi:MAG: GNAT family N-acetyltransferase [Muribaculaceae bacterium]|nr:GNAT family N-acetyltransferase [Muribaculaceae bacterium]